MRWVYPKSIANDRKTLQKTEFAAHVSLYALFNLFNWTELRNEIKGKRIVVLLDGKKKKK